MPAMASRPLDWPLAKSRWHLPVLLTIFVLGSILFVFFKPLSGWTVSEGRARVLEPSGWSALTGWPWLAVTGNATVTSDQKLPDPAFSKADTAGPPAAAFSPSPVAAVEESETSQAGVPKNGTLDGTAGNSSPFSPNTAGDAEAGAPSVGPASPGPAVPSSGEGQDTAGPGDTSWADGPSQGEPSAANGSTLSALNPTSSSSAAPAPLLLPAVQQDESGVRQKAVSPAVPPTRAAAPPSDAEGTSPNSRHLEPPPAGQLAPAGAFREQASGGPPPGGLPDGEASGDQVLSGSESSGHDSCSSEWRQAIHTRHEGRTTRQLSPAGLDALMDGLCVGGTTDSPARARRWSRGGPGLVPQQASSRSLLDSPECAKEMGDSSKPMTDEQFLQRQFLAIFSFPEQLSKGRKHLGEAVAFARRSGRVLILPRVGGSSIRMDSALPFCAYFDAAHLGRLVDWVTYEFYLAATWRLGRSPRAKFLCMERAGRGCAFEGDLRLRDILPLLAMTHRSAIDPEHVMTMVEKDAGLSKVANGIPLAKGRETLLGLTGVDLLVVGKRSPEPLIYGLNVPEALRALRYAPQLEKTADKIGALMGRGGYVAIHLRLERIRHDDVFARQVTRCCRDLIGAVRKYCMRLGFTAFYLASDISPVTLKKNSISWPDEELRLAVPAVEAVVKALKPASFELLAPTANLTYGSLQSVDPGIKSILDKLVCAKATHFIAGPRGCGGEMTYEQGILGYRTLYDKPTSSFFRWIRPPRIKAGSQ